MLYIGFIALFACSFITLAVASPAQDAPDKNSIRSYYQKLGKKNESASSACNECKLIVSELKNVINDSAKLERVKFFLKEMCRLIGGSQEQDCISMVDRLDLLLRALAPYLGSPEQFCVDIHLCNKPKIQFYSLAALHILKLTVRSANAIKVNDLLCDECVFAATEMNSLIRNPDVQQELKKQMEQICKVFPTLQAKCHQYVEQYFTFLIQFLENVMSNPQHFCAELKVCPGRSKNEMGVNEIFSTSTTKTPVRKIAIHKAYDKFGRKGKLAFFIPHIPEYQLRRVTNAACVLCKFGCEAVALNLRNKKEIIASKMGNLVCNMLPEELSLNCLDFTRIYASSIVLMTIDEYVNDEICISAGICSNETLNGLPLSNSPEFRIASCDACRTASQFISSEFRQSNFQQRVISAVKQNLCPFLPGDLSNQCLDTADQYVPMIMEHIADYVISANFCKEIGLCLKERLTS